MSSNVSNTGQLNLFSDILQQSMAAASLYLLQKGSEVDKSAKTICLVCCWRRFGWIVVSFQAFPHPPLSALREIIARGFQERYRKYNFRNKQECILLYVHLLSIELGWVQWFYDIQLRFLWKALLHGTKQNDDGKIRLWIMRVNNNTRASRRGGWSKPRRRREGHRAAINGLEGYYR